MYYEIVVAFHRKKHRFKIHSILCEDIGTPPQYWLSSSALIYLCKYCV